MSLSITPDVTSVVMCFVVAVIYSVISGLWGVMATDFFQFIFAMTGSVTLMVVVFVVAGGASELRDKSFQAVADGRVRNAVAVDRQRVDHDAVVSVLRDSLSDEGGALSKDQRREVAEATFDQFVGFGADRSAQHRRGAVPLERRGADGG